MSTQHDPTEPVSNRIVSLSFSIARRVHLPAMRQRRTARGAPERLVAGIDVPSVISNADHGRSVADTRSGATGLVRPSCATLWRLATGDGDGGWRWGMAMGGITATAALLHGQQTHQDADDGSA